MASNILLHQLHGITIGVQSIDGYLNATALTAAYRKATGKRRDVYNWLNSQRTKESLEHLAGVTGIPVTELYQVAQGGVPENQGTWLHPMLANRFAIWLADEYGYAVEQWLNEWRQAKADGRFPQNFIGHIERSPEKAAIQLVCDAVDTIFDRMADDLKVGIKIESTIALFPQLRPALEPHKPKLIITNPLVTPKRLGEILEERTGQKYSSIAVNKLLLELGYQRSTGEKNPAWEPIGKGIEYGQIVADTAKGHGKTVQACRWYESVVDRILAEERLPWKCNQESSF